MIIQDAYYSRNEISNSELGWLEKQFMHPGFVVDLEAAYRFGNLLDAMITEPGKVNVYKNQVDGVQFSAEEFEHARKMKKSFLADPFCKILVEQSEQQAVSVKENWPIEYDGLTFHVDVRCKYDFWAKYINLAADLKSTACTTQKQFEACILHFNYDRQGAWYMDIGEKDNFMFIGVSKVAPYKVFKVPMKRGGDLYRSGLQKYKELAYKHWYLFGNVNNAY